MMTFGWGIVAALNRKNKKILVFAGSITILLGVVTISFFANQMIQNN
jgi:CHASE3 domain sensor protein